jgi:hypothetical protein
VVTVADPAGEFAFIRSVPLAGTVEWRFQFIPLGSSTRVVESYTVLKPISALGWFVIRTVFGETDRKTALLGDMQETLRRIKTIVESCN